MLRVKLGQGTWGLEVATVVLEALDGSGFWAEQKHEDQAVPAFVYRQPYDGDFPPPFPSLAALFKHLVGNKHIKQLKQAYGNQRKLAIKQQGDAADAAVRATARRAQEQAAGEQLLSAAGPGGGFGMQAEAGPMAPCADDGTLSTDLQQYLYMGGGRSALASQPGPAGGYMQEHPQEQGRSPKKSRDIAGHAVDRPQNVSSMKHSHLGNPSSFGFPAGIFDMPPPGVSQQQEQDDSDAERRRKQSKVVAPGITVKQQQDQQDGQKQQIEAQVEAQRQQQQQQQEDSDREEDGEEGVGDGEVSKEEWFDDGQ